MSIKFFSGLQDLLGLYDATVATTSHTSSHIPSSNGLFPSANTDPGSAAQRRKSIGECNLALTISGEVDVDGMLFSYRRTCQNLGIATISSVERQIERLPRACCSRHEVFSVKGERISAAQMEALEEIFRRVQFDALDFEYTFLDDDAAIALSEMLEFYESAHKLNLSFNKQITVRGWTDVFKAVKNSTSLHMLNLRYTSLSEKSLSALCRVLRGTPQPVLGCLHLENVNLYGKNLYSLVCALKYNTVLKELYLGENTLQSGDGAHLYQLIMNNTAIQMLDLRNNSLGDAGIAKICEALRNPDVVKKTSLTALVLWNNKITANGMDAVAAALCENSHLETLNIGSNPLGEMGVQRLRPALGGNVSNLHRIGLQSTQMNCQSAILLAECLADNSTLIRVDLRDNPGIGSAGLLALHSAMKINRSISLLNLDQSCILASNAKVRPYQEDFRRYYEDIKHYCERNKSAVQQKIESGTADANIPSRTGSEEPMKEVEKQHDQAIPAHVIVTDTDLSPSHCQPSSSNGGSSSVAKGKFMRSSSLTCSETVADIHERLRVLGGSTHSLDETNTDSTKTIKKCPTSSHNTLGLTEWGSLPAIPQANMAAKPVVRKLRRFSVSPSSSTFDISKPNTSSAPVQESLLRPKTLSIGMPATNESSEAPHSAPVMKSSDSVNPWPTTATTASDSKSETMEGGCSTDQSSAAAADIKCSQDSSHASAADSEKPCCPNLGTNSTNISTEEANVNENSQQNFLHCQAPSESLMRDVRIVIGDLVNYVVYEETSRIERKRSLLLQTTSFTAGELMSVRSGTPDETTPSKSSSTPSRMVNIAEEVAEESEQLAVSSVVRGMVREVLRREKEELRNTLDRRRKRSSVTPSNTPV
ncbi:hypothetical protein V3C99_013743 [Haemonchus contortus]